jgi:hypothetical protein
MRIGKGSRAQRGTLIPFVGAGASRIAGCPNWSEFADGALRFFVEQGKFSHCQLAQISHTAKNGACCALSIQRIAFAVLMSELTIGVVHFNNGMALRLQKAHETRAI